MKTFEESNNRLLDIALRETGYEKGAFGGVFTTDKEFLPMRIITIITVSLANYYRINPLQADIDFLVKECENLFNSGFGPVSLGYGYSSLVDKYEELINGINKISS
ncbi:MAG: hypothetical protein ABS896_09225 [Carnobacterium inhibens]|uniref:hypothetical protein n=1 Tax=Carnobacterium inhibens TaxID=147709 RepID=UPI00331521F9